VELLDNIYRDYGMRHILKLRIPIDDKTQTKIQKFFESKPPKKLLGKKIVRTDMRDGVKMINTDGDWLLLRMSGTEPLLRVYAEARTRENTEKLIEFAKTLI
ncbi:MAG: hypothetical protein N3A61_02330, partial [Ignavibacteria bacterium]|nr:hypothetical protein [Ignavibacteria bacterium]